MNTKSSRAIIIVLIAVFCIISLGCEGSARKTSAGSDAAHIERSRQRYIDDISKPKGFRNIKIILDNLTAARSEFSAFDDLWSKVDTNPIKPANPSEFKRSGLRAGLAHESFINKMDEIRMTLNDKTRRRDALIVANNESGYMNFAKGLDVSELQYAGRTFSKNDYNFAETARFLNISAERLTGKKSRVWVTPILSRFFKVDTLLGGDLDMTDLSFELIVPDGHVIVISAAEVTDNNAAAALLPQDGEFERAETIIVIMPYFMAHLKPPDAPE